MTDHERELADAVAELASALEAVATALDASRRRTSGASQVQPGEPGDGVDGSADDDPEIRGLLAEIREIREEIDAQLAAAPTTSAPDAETAVETHTIDVRFGSDEDQNASDDAPGSPGDRSGSDDGGPDGTAGGGGTDVGPIEIDVEQELEAIRREFADDRTDEGDRGRETDDGSNGT